MEFLSDFLAWAWAVLVPAVIGMLVCDAAVYFGIKFINRKKAGLEPKVL